jgi:hypothetical protein
MKRIAKVSILSLLLSLAVACGGSTKEAPKEKASAVQTPEHKDGDEHKEHGSPATTPKVENPEHKDGDAHEGHAAAPGDHAHESPHGGKVATSGDKHLELKMNDEGHIDVFVLDGNTKPISAKNAQGKVKLTLSDGIKEFPLSYDEKGDHLTAKASEISAKKVVALVDLTIDGKSYSARFDYEFEAHSH